MAKMIIMRGLPASGKSTLAQEIVAKEGNTVRINKDLLRMMLHFDKFTGKNEGQTRDAARALARTFLTQPNGGANVIIDDTNLNPGTMQSWKDLAKEVGAKIQHVEVDTPMEVCLERDRARERRVGDHTIVGMALQYGLYPKPQKGIVLCDLDGTLCDIRHRLHHVKGETKDWKAFFAGIPEDALNDNVHDMVLDYHSKGYPIIFLSARPDKYRKETEEWIRAAFDGIQIHEAVLMRPSNDTRPDTEVKKGMYEKYFKDKYPIQLVIDDRPSVIRMWREQGLNVVDVGEGVDF